MKYNLTDLACDAKPWGFLMQFNIRAKLNCKHSADDFLPASGPFFVTILLPLNEDKPKLSV